MSLYFFVTASLLLLTLSLSWRIYRCKIHAKAPGPFLARYTRLWYAWKIWLGEWEKLDIELHKKNGPVVRIAPSMYSIDDPTAMKALYGINSDMPKSSWYSAFGQPGVPDHNLFSAVTKNVHSAMRRRQAALYSMSAIRSYESSVDTTIKTLFQQFDSFAEGGQLINLQHWMQCYAFDTIGLMTYGWQFGFMDAQGHDISNLMRDIGRGLWYNSITGLISQLKWILFPINLAISLPVFKIIAKYDKMAESKYMDSKANPSEIDSDSEDETKPMTFWNKVQAQREKNPEDYIKYRGWVTRSQNVFAGSDTTSIALTSFLYHTIKNPRVWQKLAQELEEATNSGQVSEQITFEQAQKLKYLQYTIKEALRIHPSAGLPYWRVVPPNGLEIAGVSFTAGSWVGINPYVAHMNPDVFGADADVFNPDRWDPNNTSKSKLEAMEAYWLPFGSGSRTCIGKNVSLLEMNKLLPEIMKRYTFELDKPSSEKLKSENNWFVKQTNVMARIIKRGERY